jgi:Asp-tRNA(Asn)/Glu-tRNA(Gln) amidotransferase A subunit family amidase
MADLHTLSAAELFDLYQRKAVSPVDVTHAVLDHIARWEPHLHATYALDAEGALAQAEASQSRWLKGEPAGPLDGVPTMIKENIATVGVPVPLGTAATELTPAPHDAPPAARLRESGAVILGKTTMPDYGMLSSGLSSFHPLTRNPWDLSRGPGGSSSGAGAGAAAGYGPLHVGTDIGGSVRLPAGWCGIFTLKPSLGRIPIHPPYAGRVAGPMTRTVRGRRADDGGAEPTRPARHDEPAGAGDRLGKARAPGRGPAHRPADGRRLGSRRRARGARRSRGGGPRVRGRRRDRRAARAVHDADDGRGASMRSGACARGSTSRHSTPSAATACCRSSSSGRAAPQACRASASSAATARWARCATPRSAACAPFDVVLTPTAPVPAFAAELPCPTNDPTRPFEHIAFTVPYNMSEQPAASINCGYTADGLPIGLQIVGHRHDDLTVLQVARAWEQMRPAQRPWPEPPA